MKRAATISHSKRPKETLLERSGSTNALRRKLTQMLKPFTEGEKRSPESLEISSPIDPINAWKEKKSSNLEQSNRILSRRGSLSSIFTVDHKKDSLDRQKSEATLVDLKEAEATEFSFPLKSEILNEESSSITSDFKNLKFYEWQTKQRLSILYDEISSGDHDGQNLEQLIPFDAFQLALDRFDTIWITRMQLLK